MGQTKPLSSGGLQIYGGPRYRHKQPQPWELSAGREVSPRRAQSAPALPCPSVSLVPPSTSSCCLHSPLPALPSPGPSQG